jgi:hypothetical protein
MKRILGRASAVLFTVAALSTFTAPAMAGSGFGFSIGGGHGFHDRHHGGITFGFDTRPSHHNAWRRHVRWCFDHYASYDPDSNRYFNGHRWRVCRSPFI